MISAHMLATVSLLAALATTAGAQDAAGAQADSLLLRQAHLDVRQERLETALQTLSRRSGVPIAFSPDLVRPYPPVSCACERATVAAALDSLLAGTTLRYVEARSRIVVAPAHQEDDAERSPAAQLAPASGAIAGSVLSAADSTSIPGALVTVSGRLGELRADATGRFRTILPAGAYRITVRALGYGPVQVPRVVLASGATTTVMIYLTPVAIELSAIVVAPSTYGLQREETPVPPQVLTREEMQTRPHGGEDIYRAVNRLPGITTDDISAKLHVRGSASDQVLEQLDGVELYEPYHLKDQDGVLSIIDVESVSDVRLLTGGFPVEYGNKMAGVVSMRTINPRPDRTTTTLALSLMNVMVNSQGGFASGRGTWLASARRGYLDLVLDLTNATQPGSDLSPRYYDLLGRIEYQLGYRHRIAGHVLYARDHFSIVEEDRTALHSHYGSSYGWINWRADFTDRLSAVTTAAAGRVTHDRDGSDPLDDADVLRLQVNDTATFQFLNAKQDWTLLLSERVLARWGLDYKRGLADYNYFRWQTVLEPNLTDPLAPPFSTRPDTVVVTTRPEGAELGAYFAGRVRPAAGFIAEVGVRYDRRSYDQDHTLGPRVMAAWEFAPRTTLRAAWGYYYQPQRLYELQVIDGDTTFYPPQRAEHRILGLEHQLSRSILVRLEGYDRRVEDPRPEYRSLLPRYESLPEEGPDDRVRIAASRSRARGVEVFVRHDGGDRLAWFASYALAVAEDEVGGTWIPRPYDQRHTLRLDVAYRPTPSWSVGWAWQYHSGWPATAQSFTTDTLATGDPYFTGTFGPLYAERLPAYHRLDVRISKHFRAGSGRLTVYADVFNLYDRENAKTYEYTPRLVGDVAVVERSTLGMVGILPSIGVRWQF
jgi:outer membrane cobalamin receptor